MNPDGSRGRALRREVAQLAGAIAAQEAAEQEAEALGELPAETIAALEAEHDIRIGLAIKAAEIAARDRDSAPALINQQREEGETAAEWKPELKPRVIKRKQS
jgi:hypothetical protein